MIGLSQGDAETVRQWQSQFGRFICTWLYYQLNKDEFGAATLTAQSLSQALRELSAFDPEQTTMYLWLKDIASQQLQVALTQRQIKAQRPCAWSEMPPKVLDSLKRFRTEPLIPDVSGCGAVVEMVQASLADLSEQDRDLLVRRYIRLDTVEQLASELNLSGEKVNQQLYLARHAFRRGFFCMIQSVAPDFSEPAVSGGVELFESNLESLLRSVNAAMTLSSDHAEQIKRAVLQTASEIAQNPPVLAKAAPQSKMMLAALAGAGVLIVAMAVFIWAGWGAQKALPTETVAVTPPPVVEVNPPAAPVDEKQQAAIDAEELKRVMDMGVRGDVAGLLNVLKTDSFILQMTAAHYLGQVGDESAIGPLEEALARWFPDGSEDNPFFDAIFEIEKRLGEKQIKEAVVALPPAVEKPKETSKPEAVKPLLLSGLIKDFDGSPLSGVQVSIQKETPTQEAAGVVQPKLTSAMTDDKGQYNFKTLPDGLFVVAVRDAQRRIADTNRLMWAVKDQPCTIDFGGPVSVAGTLSVDGNVLAGQTVLLSDQFQDPTQGVFTAEAETGASGSFLFSGVPAGVYRLYWRFAANRWTLMEKVEVGSVDVMALIEQPTVMLNIQAQALPETLQIASMSLRYSPDSSDALAEWTAIKTADETVFEINKVIPGNYTLCVDFSNGVRTLRDIAVTTEALQEILLDSAPFGTAGLSGRFLSPWPEGLVLTCAEPPMRINLMAEEDASYVLSDLPPAVYTVSGIVNRMLVPYLELGLSEGQPAVLDPDPQALAKTRSPLYVYVTDAQGRGLSGGQVWLTGETGAFAAQPFGRGFFAAVPPGQYALSVTFAGYSAYERQVTLSISEVHAVPSDKNTEVVRLEKQ